MALKIKIKHNVSGKVLPLHLKYEDATKNFPEIPVNIEDSEQTVDLSDWNVGEEGIDVEKVKITEDKYQVGNDVYNIEAVNIGIDPGADTSSSEVKEEMANRDPSTIAEPTCDDSAVSNWDAILAAHKARNYTERTRLIKEDPTKFFYDRSYDIRNTSYNASHYNDEEFEAKYGDIVSGAFMVDKAGVPSYGSILFGPVLIEANSRYAKFKDWEKSSLMTQTINEEGRKNGVTCHGYITKNQGTNVLSLRIPDEKDSVYVKSELFTGNENNASILYICVVPSYSEASSSYSPAVGVFYVDDVAINSDKQKPFVRVKIDNGNHSVRVENVKYGGKTNWNTLGTHYITTPLYSDNILKIVLFNDNEDHGIYPNLYLQAKNNKWGLPCTMFENGGSDTPSGSDDPSVTPPEGSNVVNTTLMVRYIQQSDGKWTAYAFLNANNENISYPVTFKKNGTVIGTTNASCVTAGDVLLNYQGTVGSVDKFDVVPDVYVMDGNNAYEVVQVDESYDVYAGYNYGWAEPSNKGSLNFDYAKLDHSLLYGNLASEYNKDGNIALEGDIESAFYAGTNGTVYCSKSTVSSNLRFENTVLDYRRCLDFGWGQRIVGPFKATVTGDEQYTLAIPNGLRILDSNYQDITSRFTAKTITYNHNGSTYTGNVLVGPDENDYTQKEKCYLVYQDSILLES